MVVCCVESSSFGLIFLLISFLKLCGFSETSKEYEDSCSADIYNSRFRFCPKGRRSMADMGNSAGQFVCGVKEKESSNEADESPAEMLPASKSKEEDDTEKQRKILPGHEFRIEKSLCGEKGKESSNEADESPAEMLPESKSKEEDDTEKQGKILPGHEFRKVDGKHVLHNVKTGRRFEFDVFDGNRAKNQRRYEDLGEAITEYVYEYLEKDLGLEKVTIPVGAKKKDPKGFFFMSKDALKAEKLMILIHGSGVVRAGQWARSLIINDSFETGTMVPYIERARQEGYGVLITNGNQNYDEKKRKRIKDSESPEEHFAYVWKKFIKDAKAKDIVIVAHSFGGVVVQYCVRNIQEAMERIKAVAFTDSVHSVGYGESSQIKKWFKQKTINWVSSDKDLDTPITSYYGKDSGVLVSAGTTEHVWTSHCAKESVFKFFKEKLAGGEKSGKDDMENNDSNEDERTKDTAKDNAKGQENTKGAHKNTNTGQEGKSKCGKKPGCGDDERKKNNQEGSEPDERQLEKGSKEGETEAKEQNQHEEDRGSGDASGLKDTEGGSEKDETVRLTTGENENTVLDDKKGGEKAGNVEQENKDQDTGGEGWATGKPGEKDKRDENGGLKTEDNLHAQCDEKEKKKALDNAGERKKGDEDMDTGGDGSATGKPGEKDKLDEKGGLKAEENLDRKVEDEQGEEKPRETNQEKFATDGYPMEKPSAMEVDEEGGGGDGGGDVEMEETLYSTANDYKITKFV